MSDEKTFTQDEVNKIVQKRLAEEKAKNDAALVDRENELNHREFLLGARETLAAKGLPADLLDALNTSSKEAFEKSLSIIGEKIKTAPPAIETPATVARVAMSGRHTEPESLTVGDQVRRAMGLQKE